ncbi:hypothetical protein BVI2075_200018 [Burkholderia vietnamiensis]|nr:hypothetical protein BVI2075_200018 [Burkholderia vietnamiensis]CAG9232164.1 hypothetical protein BVI1335_830018 [Burkholderia vietnamiensis]
MPEPGHGALERAPARVHRRLARRGTLPVLRHALQAARRRGGQGPLSPAAGLRARRTRGGAAGVSGAPPFSLSDNPNAVHARRASLRHRKST